LGRAQGKTSVVVLNTELNDDLIHEGIARDVVRIIQDRRKTIGCQLSDRIEVGIETDDASVVSAVEKFRDYIASETLARQLVLEPLAGVEPGDGKAGEARFKAYVRRLAE